MDRVKDSEGQAAGDLLGQHSHRGLQAREPALLMLAEFCLLPLLLLFFLCFVFQDRVSQ